MAEALSRGGRSAGETSAGTKQGSPHRSKTETSFKRLKPGPGLSAEAVAWDQRQRLRDALVRIVSASGANAVTVRGITHLAGVSTRTFYQRFSSTEECFDFAYESTMEKALRRAKSAIKSAGDREARLQRLIYSLYDSFAAQPTDARLALTSAYGAGAQVRRRLRTTLSELDQTFDEALVQTRPDASPPRHLVAGITAATLAVARRTLNTNRHEELPPLSRYVSDWTLRILRRELIAVRPGQLPLNRQTTTRNTESSEGSASRLRSDSSVRSRILRAVVEVACDSGYSQLSAEGICANADVSPRDFDTNFGGVEDSFLDALETTARDALMASIRGVPRTTDQEVRVHDVIRGVCRDAADSPRRARLVFAEILVPGTAGLLRRDTIFEQLAGLLLADRSSVEEFDRVATTASLSAVWHIIQAEVCSGRAKQLPDLAPLLSYIVLAPSIAADRGSASLVRKLRALE